MLGAMFGGKFKIWYNDSGYAFIDRDDRMFGQILNFLRTGSLILPQNFPNFELLESEADFYQLRPHIDKLKETLPESLTEGLGEILYLLLRVRKMRTKQDYVRKEHPAYVDKLYGPA